MSRQGHCGGGTAGFSDSARWMVPGLARVRGPGPSCPCVPGPLPQEVSGPRLSSEGSAKGQCVQIRRQMLRLQQVLCPQEASSRPSTAVGPGLRPRGTVAVPHPSPAWFQTLLSALRLPDPRRSQPWPSPRRTTCPASTPPFALGPSGLLTHRPTAPPAAVSSEPSSAPPPAVCGRAQRHPPSPQP